MRSTCWESCQITGDVVFFNATATRFRINELKRYFGATGRQARYVVFSEPLVHLPGGLVIDPAKLSLKELRPTSLSSEEWPPQYVHNYRGLAEQLGSRTLHYRVYEPSFWRGIHRIDLIAEHPRQAGTFVSRIRKTKLPGYKCHRFTLRCKRYTIISKISAETSRITGMQFNKFVTWRIQVRRNPPREKPQFQLRSSRRRDRKTVLRILQPPGSPHNLSGLNCCFYRSPF